MSETSKYNIVNLFISYLLNSQNTSFVVQNNLDNTYFIGQEDIWFFIKNYVDSNGILPSKEIVFTKFPSFQKDYIDTIDETPDYLLTELSNNRTINIIAKGYQETRDILSSTRDVEKAKAVLRSVDDQISSSVSFSSVDIFEDTSRYNDYLERVENPNKHCISTGFSELDNVLGGGWDKQEELATIVGRTGQGKSWIGLKMALAGADAGLRVGYYSGEMSEKKVGYRLDTLLGGGKLPNGALVHANANGSILQNYQTYMNALPNRLKGTIRVLTPNMINGPAGVSALKSFIEKDRLDMLVVDQHSLLEDDRHAKNPIEKASNISRDLKNLQVMEKIPIIAISQQNRTSTENGVGTEHVAQSDRIGQDSTVILFVERDKKDKTLLTLELVKSRDSESGVKLKYKIDLNYGQFSYIDESGDSEDSSINTYPKASTTSPFVEFDEDEF